MSSGSTGAETGGGPSAPLPLPGRRPLAVLDTSAWVAAHRAEVAANLLGLFRISQQAANRKLDLITPITSPAFIADARQRIRAANLP